MIAVQETPGVEAQASPRAVSPGPDAVSLLARTRPMLGVDVCGPTDSLSSGQCIEMPSVGPVASIGVCGPIAPLSSDHGSSGQCITMPTIGPAELERSDRAEGPMDVDVSTFNRFSPLSECEKTVLSVSFSSTSSTSDSDSSDQSDAEDLDTSGRIGANLCSQEQTDLEASGLLSGGQMSTVGDQEWGSVMASGTVNPNAVIDITAPGYPIHPGVGPTLQVPVDESTLKSSLACAAAKTTAAGTQSTVASLGLGKTCTEGTVAAGVSVSNLNPAPLVNSAKRRKSGGSRGLKGSRGAKRRTKVAAGEQIKLVTRYTPGTANTAHLASRLRKRWSGLPVRCQQMPGVYGFFEGQAAMPGFSAALRFPFVVEAGGSKLVCPHCDASVTTAKNLIRHVLGSHYPWTSRYSCPVKDCPHPGSLRKSDLRSHLTVGHSWKEGQWKTFTRGPLNLVPTYNPGYMPPNPADKKDTPFSFNLQVVEDAQLLGTGQVTFPPVREIESDAARTPSQAPGVFITQPWSHTGRPATSQASSSNPKSTSSVGRSSIATATVTSDASLTLPPPTGSAGPAEPKKMRKRKSEKQKSPPLTGSSELGMELDLPEIASSATEEVGAVMASPLVVPPPKARVVAQPRITGQVIQKLVQSSTPSKKRKADKPSTAVYRKPGKPQLGEFLPPDSSRVKAIPPGLRVPTHTGSASDKARPVPSWVAQSAEAKAVGVQYVQAAKQMSEQAGIAEQTGSLGDLRRLQVGAHEHYEAARILHQVSEEARTRAHEVWVETQHRISYLSRKQELDRERANIRAPLEREVAQLKTQVQSLRAQLQESDARTRRAPTPAPLPVFGTADDSQATITLLQNERDIFRSALVDVLAGITTFPETAVNPDVLVGRVRGSLRSLPSDDHVPGTIRTSSAAWSSLISERCLSLEKQYESK